MRHSIGGKGTTDAISLIRHLHSGTEKECGGEVPRENLGKWPGGV